MMGSIKNGLLYVKTALRIRKIQKKLKAKHASERKSELNILFCPFNSSILNMGRESLIASSCQNYGASVQFLQFDIYARKNEFQPNRSKLSLSIYYSIGRLFYRINKFKTVRYKQYQDNAEFERMAEIVSKLPVEDIESFEFKGIKIGELAITGAIRTFLSPYPIWDEPRFEIEVRLLLKEACRIAICSELILERNNFDKIVMSHGIYLSWGILFKLARDRGIDVDVYNSSYRRNTLRVYKNAPNAPFPEAEWPTYKELALTSSENKLLDSYISSREDQRDDNVQLFGETKENSEVDAFISKAKSKNAKIACLFTNISWDAYSFASGALFTSMNSWLEETIEYISKNYSKEIFLIIKAHPAEKYHKVPDEFRIKHSVPNHLPENILFITEEMEVKPFVLYENIDFGVIHISTVSIEMALKNIPVLTSGAGGHYSKKNFTYDPTTKEEYFRTLDELIKGECAFVPDIEMARRYMYYRFFTEAIPFGYMNIQNGIINVDPEKFESDPNNYSGLKAITEGVLFNEPFVFDWAQEEIA